MAVIALPLVGIFIITVAIIAYVRYAANIRRREEQLELEIAASSDPGSAARRADAAVKEMKFRTARDQFVMRDLGYHNVPLPDGPSETDVDHRLNSVHDPEKAAYEIDAALDAIHEADRAREAAKKIWD